MPRLQLNKGPANDLLLPCSCSVIFTFVSALKHDLNSFICYILAASLNSTLTPHRTEVLLIRLSPDEDIHPLMALLPNALKRVLSGPMNNDPAP